MNLDEAQGEAPGALDQGDDLKLVIGGRLGEDVSRTDMERLGY